MPELKTTPGNTEKNDTPQTQTSPSRNRRRTDLQLDATLSKEMYLAGLPPKVRKEIETAIQNRDLGYGVPIPRNTCPDGSDRTDLFPEWAYRLLEASFIVEDRLEHERRNQRWVKLLNQLRNQWLDIIGENEPNPVQLARQVKKSK